jgi:hypothetical protein
VTLRKITNLIYEKIAKKKERKVNRESEGRKTGYDRDAQEIRMGTAKIKTKFEAPPLPNMTERTDQAPPHVIAPGPKVSDDRSDSSSRSSDFEPDRSDFDDSSDSCLSRDPDYILEDDDFRALPLITEEVMSDERLSEYNFGNYNLTEVNDLDPRKPGVAKEEQRKSQRKSGKEESKQEGKTARPNLNLDFLQGLTKVKEQILQV